ncbi:MAG: thrombospondin type 3 repeat-containing protein, partial [Thiohalorhabdaceae bacterium]
LEGDRWRVTVSGEPWEPSSGAGLGLTGIEVDLSAGELGSPLYRVRSNDKSSLIVQASEDLTRYSGKELIGVHKFRSLVAKDGAQPDFGGDRVRVLGRSEHPGDTDGDGLGDREEAELHGTDPNRADSDGDGLSDGLEKQIGADPSSAQEEDLTALRPFLEDLVITPAQVRPRAQGADGAGIRLRAQDPAIRPASNGGQEVAGFTVAANVRLESPEVRPDAVPPKARFSLSFNADNSYGKHWLQVSSEGIPACRIHDGTEG